MYLKILVGILMFGLTACSTTIGNKNDLGTTEFKINQTKTTDVVDYLGLPAKISKNEEEKKQYWYYREGAELSGLILPVVDASSGGSLSGSTTEVGVSGMSTDHDFVVMFVFDQDDTLIKVSK